MMAIQLVECIAGIWISNKVTLHSRKIMFPTWSLSELVNAGMHHLIGDVSIITGVCVIFVGGCIFVNMICILGSK